MSSTSDDIIPSVSMIKRKEEPIGNDEYKEPKSCGNCIHKNSCGAYWLLKRMIKDLHKEFGSFIQFPMPLAMLAEGCKEYTDKRKVTKPDK